MSCIFSVIKFNVCESYELVLEVNEIFYLFKKFKFLLFQWLSLRKNFEFIPDIFINNVSHKISFKSDFQGYVKVKFFFFIKNLFFIVNQREKLNYLFFVKVFYYFNLIVQYDPGF